MPTDHPDALQTDDPVVQQLVIALFDMDPRRLLDRRYVTLVLEEMIAIMREDDLLH